MNYQEAYAQSSELLGRVKCTYTILYEADGTELFSLQKTALSDPDKTAAFYAYNNEPVIAKDGLVTVALNTDIAEWCLNYVAKATKNKQKKIVAKLYDYLKKNNYTVKVKANAVNWEPVKQKNYAIWGIIAAVASQMFTN